MCHDNQLDTEPSLLSVNGTAYQIFRLTVEKRNNETERTDQEHLSFLPRKTGYLENFSFKKKKKIVSVELTAIEKSLKQESTSM